jgi:seryl-tRNA(Sec) selenium transferase
MIQNSDMNKDKIDTNSQDCPKYKLAEQIQKIQDLNSSFSQIQEELSVLIAETLNRNSDPYINTQLRNIAIKFDSLKKIINSSNTIIKTIGGAASFEVSRNVFDGNNNVFNMVHLKRSVMDMRLKILCCFLIVTAMYLIFINRTLSNVLLLLLIVSFIFVNF